MINARLEVFAAMKTHVVVLWVVTPCSVVVGYQRFGGLRMKVEVEQSSEMLISYYSTTRCQNPQDVICGEYLTKFKGK
jgi:hypothetical protein